MWDVIEIHLRDWSWIELVRDCGDQDDERGAQREAGQGEGGGGRHEEAGPAHLGQDGQHWGDTQQAEPDDGHQATVSDNKDIFQSLEHILRS